MDLELSGVPYVFVISENDNTNSVKLTFSLNHNSASGSLIYKIKKWVFRENSELFSDVNNNWNDENILWHLTV